MNPAAFVQVSYYAAMNLGDDLFLLTLLHRYPDIIFIIEAKCEELLPRVLPENLLVADLSDDHVFLKRGRASRLGCLCQIGGSIFIEPRGVMQTLRMIAKRYSLYSSFTHTYILGANWGPCRSRFFYNAFRRMFRTKVEDICFRDTASYDKFSDLPNARFSPDILFSLSMPKVAKHHAVLFSVIDLFTRDGFGPLSRHSKNYFDWIVNSARWFSSKGFDLIISSFCKLEGDESAVDFVKEKLFSLNIDCRVLNYCGNVDEMLGAIATCEVVVATRFHATVLGIDAGARVLPVPYSTKTINVLHDIGFDMNNVQMIDAIDPDDLSVCERVVTSEPFQLGDLPKGAEGHFLALDQMLDRR